MIAYIDTSALVKRYLDEHGSDQVNRLFSEASHLETSFFTDLELTSTIERARREQKINSPYYKKIGTLIKEDIQKGRLSVINLTTQIYQSARDLIKIHRLRAPDSIQLASALFMNRRFLREHYKFICSDNALLYAAKLEGLECINPAA